MEIVLLNPVVSHGPPTFVWEEGDHMPSTTKLGINENNSDTLYLDLYNTGMAFISFIGEGEEWCHRYMTGEPLGEE